MSNVFSLNVVVDDNVDYDILSQILFDLNEIANVEIVEDKIKKITKGEMILEMIISESQKPNDEFVMTRQEIANEIGCVVGRIAEIIRDNNDNEDVINYVNRVKNDRKIKSAEKTLKNLQMKMSILQNNDMIDILEKSIENVENA